MRNGDNLLDDDDVAREGDGDGFDDNDDDMDDAVARDATILSTTRPIRDEGEEASQRSQNQSQARSNVMASTPTEPVQITDEIRERIERNKRIAIEKRLARMQVLFLKRWGSAASRLDRNLIKNRLVYAHQHRHITVVRH